MSRLKWDQTGKRTYETGVDRGVLYVYDPDGKAYEDGVAWNGLTAINETPSGAEPTAHYADNIKYLNLMSAEEFGFTLEAFTYPEEFGMCDGSAVEQGVFIGQQARAPFGLAYRTLIGNDTQANDYGYQIHLVWNAMASPSEKAHNTVNENPEPTTMSWTASTTPTPFTKHDFFKPTAHMYIDSTKTEPAILKRLEDIIWGSEDNEPTLPSPDEVLDIVYGNAPGNRLDTEGSEGSAG